MSLSDAASSHAPCPPPRGSESRFARENESVGAWQRTTSKASTRTTALATSSIVGRARGRVCGGAPLVTAASTRHLTSHRDKDCAGWVLSDQVSRLVRSACSSRLAARSHGRQRDRQRHRARAVRSFRDDRQHPLGIQVGDVGLRCAWPACDGAVGGRRSAVGGRWSAVGGRRVAIDGGGGGGGAGDGRRGGSGLGLWFVVELFL